MRDPYSYIEVGLYFLLLLAAVPLLGEYCFRILRDRNREHNGTKVTWEDRFLRSIGIDPDQEMTWKTYAVCLLSFNLVGLLAVFLLQVTQELLPLNPNQVQNVPPLLALNTAISFVTNTNWQAYSGESSLSYLSQMAGLTVQNFLSAATGIAVMVALARGFLRKTCSTIGNFWVDMVRSCVFILLPLSLLFSLLLMWQGVPQTFQQNPRVMGLEQQKEQIIPVGPVASQVSIKQLGTNGGGYFGTNSAHPFENPTPFSNFLQVLAILLLPAALVWTFGRLISSQAHGGSLFAVMLFVLFLGFGLSCVAQADLASRFGTETFLEGQEIRISPPMSVLWSTVTTAASNGSVNAMHDSLSPLAGGVALLNIMLGEIIFGGVGVGVCGMVFFVVVVVFLAGLLVGRSPEYLGKKIERLEILLAAAVVLIPCVVILLFSGLTTFLSAEIAALVNRGPHALSEVLYAFSSATNNNGSAFGGLDASRPYFLVSTAICMLIGRSVIILPSLMLAGSLAGKKTTPPSAGTFPVQGLTFAIFLLGVILIVSALSFFPALALGPFVEHLLLSQGRTF